MANYATGLFAPVNPQKYIGKYPIRYRSSWELPMMQLFDKHPNVLGWSSESISIPYRNPLTSHWTVYIPDFLVIYVDKNMQKHCDMIEIKPEKEMPGYAGKVSSRTKLIQAINAAKWQAAIAYCVKRGWIFRVANERELFAFKRKGV